MIDFRVREGIIRNSIVTNAKLSQISRYNYDLKKQIADKVVDLDRILLSAYRVNVIHHTDYIYSAIIDGSNYLRLGGPGYPWEDDVVVMEYFNHETSYHCAEMVKVTTNTYIGTTINLIARANKFPEAL